MTDMKTTLVLLVIAVVLGIAALFAVPSSVEPEAFSDQGELFFSPFEPADCKEIEVYNPDAENGTVDVFDVQFDGGLWRIPSHNGYPADAKDRMALAATALIGLRKDLICSDRIEDRTKLGVEDPLDDASSVEGRGKRIILKDGSGRVLADIIVGKQKEDMGDKSDFMRQPKEFVYMRQPDSKRIYAVNIRPDPQSYGETIKDISTKFSDWIDTDLLHLQPNEVKKVMFDNYSVNEETGKLENRETLELAKGEDDHWSMDGLGEEEQVKESTVQNMTRTLDSLLITGVRPTPEPLTRSSMASKGFFVDKDGNLYGNEGQMEVRTEGGVIYELYFGEVLFGSGKAVTAGTEEDASAQEPGKEASKDQATENRYLFVRVMLDPEVEEKANAASAAAKAEAEELAKAKDAEKAAAEEAAAPEAGADKTAAADKKEEKTELQKEDEKCQQKLTDAKKRVDDLNLRFSKWYYLISDDSFKKLRLGRNDLVEKKLPDVSAIGEQPDEKREPIKRPSGLAYVDIERGSGRPARDGDEVKVLYTGWLKDGTEFDKNQDAEKPFTFTLGKGQVIKGWDEGIKGMTPGGKRKLIIPPDLGYGSEGAGDNIPPDSFLIFDVKLLDVKEQKGEP